MAALASAAVSPAPVAATASQHSAAWGTHSITFVGNAAPTPTQHVNDQQNVQILERKWRSLSQSMRSNSQTAADVLMKQAQATSQLDEMLQLMFIHLKSVSDDRSRLQQQLMHERTVAAAQAEDLANLQQRLQLSESRAVTVKAVTDSLQGQLAQAREALEASQRESEQLKEQLREMEEQLTVTSECRVRGDTIMAEQAAVLEALRQQLDDQSSAAAILANDKASLEAQLHGVLQAEQELTVHLRETHTAIEGQLSTLREQLKTERQKRAAVVKRRGELQAQVEQLQAQVASQQADMAALVERLGRAGGSGQQSSAGARSITPSSKPVQAARAVASGSWQAGQVVRPITAAVIATAGRSPSPGAGVVQLRARAPLRPAASSVANTSAPHLAGAPSNAVDRVERSSTRLGSSRQEDEPHSPRHDPGGASAGHSPATVSIPMSVSGTAPPSGEVPTQGAAAKEDRKHLAAMEPPSPPIHLTPTHGHDAHLASSVPRRRSVSPRRGASTGAKAHSWLP
ncbi:hypothetical protein HYH02_014942 [Chlamydomonas schloesseri]|uniref:Uncharacterized protein n=1 Tax=Chlamydomonas schloesseri TaxID=2026947 RepID=A0A835VUD4_9CHLO|nr:hypothetical protein HYH02_014942 [Chlamydomonas schloesseri]|eukprot:KAG2425879.1 hypothetical protein HYH02_014942 [Chlamydomonas schloesseri]